MINGKTVMAFIPARGGSKGIPRKNIAMAAGKPLLAWTIEAARGSRYIDRLILTSDDETIIGVAREWGCEAPFVRPAELARDDTPGMDMVMHTVHNMPAYDYILQLQPTSPLRTSEDIDLALELTESRGAAACVSVTKLAASPHWMYAVDERQRMSPLLERNKLLPRQSLPDTYTLNGAICLAERKWLLQSRTFMGEETIAYVMPRERSVDIDAPIDLVVFEALIAARDKPVPAERGN
ncbi:acylneuraminate cytidylyltransferase family protein [Paenibacillus cymbidii]|uniref:acylneuraminate cytidylyltransferase family protein n=1 Tax=Paenibacillus cymbidii TaxID=1639034 RepID=UPI0010808598|nr:acylneuraminate cytidylyltransferase family protein [Paenibacillus cymbidii]